MRHAIIVSYFKLLVKIRFSELIQFYRLQIRLQRYAIYLNPAKFCKKNYKQDNSMKSVETYCFRLVNDTFRLHKRYI